MIVQSVRSNLFFLIRNATSSQYWTVEVYLNKHRVGRYASWGHALQHLGDGTPRVFVSTRPSARPSDEVQQLRAVVRESFGMAEETTRVFTTPTEAMMHMLMRMADVKQPQLREVISHDGTSVRCLWCAGGLPLGMIDLRFEEAEVLRKS